MNKIPIVSIIDDDVVFQFTAKKFIQSTNLVDQILQFPDGQAAIEYFKENKRISENLPDLVFLDLNMPYLDGLQFLDEFASITLSKEEITIYICTSSDSPFDRDKFTDYPKLKGYLIKPINKDKFESLVKNQLGLI